MVKERHADHVWPWNMVKLGFLYFMNIIAAANKICWLLIPRAFSTIKFSHSTPNKTILSHHDLTMNDHQTWSMKLWYKYWILTFLNTVKQSNLSVKKILMGCHPAQFYRNHKKLEKISWPCLTVKHGQGKTCWPCMTMKHGQIRLSLFLWILLQLQTRSVDCWYQELFPL